MRFYGAIATNLGQLLIKHNINSRVNVDSLLIETKDGKSRSIDFETTSIVTTEDTVNFKLKGLHETFLEDWSDLGVKETSDLENNTELFEKAKITAIVLTFTDDNVLDSNFMKQVKTKVMENILLVGDKILSSDNNGIAVMFVD